MSKESNLVTDALALAAALLAGLAAIAGLAVPGLYRDAPFWAQQARGTDVATLFLAMPILLVGLWMARRGRAVGRLAATGSLLYLVYNYAIFAFSVAMNPLLAVYIATLGFAVWSLALAVTSGTLLTAAFPRLPRRTTAGVLIAVAGIFALLWVSQIAASVFAGTVPVDVERAELPTNPVFALDLALFLPLCGVAAIGLLWRAPAAAFAMPTLIWLFLTSVGIIGAFAFATAAGDAFPVVPAAIVTAIGVVTAGLATLGAVRSSIGRSAHTIMATSLA